MNDTQKIEIDDQVVKAVAAEAAKSISVPSAEDVAQRLLISCLKRLKGRKESYSRR
jgi:hypothetical protein